MVAGSKGNLLRQSSHNSQLFNETAGSHAGHFVCDKGEKEFDPVNIIAIAKEKLDNKISHISFPLPKTQ